MADGITEMSNEEKAKIMDNLIDYLCDSCGVYETINLLHNNLGLNYTDLQRLHFTINDLDACEASNWED